MASYISQRPCLKKFLRFHSLETRSPVNYEDSKRKEYYFDGDKKKLNFLRSQELTRLPFLVENWRTK